MREEEALVIVRRPYVTEKTFLMIEGENALTFIVDDEANKPMVKEAIEKLYGVKVKGIRIARSPQGKKAYVRFEEGYSAMDLASRMRLV